MKICTCFTIVMLKCVKSFKTINISLPLKKNYEESPFFRSLNVGDPLQRRIDLSSQIRYQEYSNSLIINSIVLVELGSGDGETSASAEG